MDNLWGVFECLCSCGYKWVEVTPILFPPTQCPRCGHFNITIGSGLSKPTPQ